MEEKRQIIALSCSPSRGRNSDTMLDNFIKGAQKVAGIEIEKIYLEDVPIDLYKFENGEGPENHEIEFKKLLEKIRTCEGLIISTPTYNFSVPAHLKNFIDRTRCVSLNMDDKNLLGQPVGKMNGVRVYFLVSGGTPLWAQKILFFAFPPFWLRSVYLYFGANVMGAYYSGDIRSYENKRILNKCFKKGSCFAKAVVNGKTNKITEKVFWRPPQKN